MSHSSLVGGSSAQRMINCPAHFKLAKGMPTQVSSVYAREGTALHAIMEMLLLDEVAFTPEEVIGYEIEVEPAVFVTITPELYHEKVVPAWEATKELFKQFGVTEYEPEVKVEFRSIPGAFGTCDLLALTPFGPIIVDYKFGDGHLVSPVNSAQLTFYAAAAAETPEWKAWFMGYDSVTVGIIQPANDPVLQTVAMPMKELGAFTASLAIATHQAVNADMEPNPGEWCKWCPASPRCPAIKKKARRAIETMNPEILTDLSEAMELAVLLEPWIAEVKAATHLAMEKGERVSGWKLVAKRAIRKWKDEAAAHLKLKKMKRLVKADYEDIKLLSPTQIEKVCKIKSVDFEIFDSYIEAVSSGTTMAPADDKRPEITVNRDREIPDHLRKLMK